MLPPWPTGAGVRLGQDDPGGDQEDDRQDRERVALEHVHQVVAEERDHDLQDDDDDQARGLRQVRERVEGERAAHAVHREPAHPGGDGVQAGGQHVAPVTEAEAAQHHLRDPVDRALLGQQPLGDGADRGPDDDPEHGLPEVQAERGDREHADEDRRELHVRRAPRPEQLQRLAVPFVQRDELGTAGLDGDDPLAVGSLASDRAGRHVLVGQDSSIMVGHGHVVLRLACW